MVNLEDAVIARLKTHGETYELLVDPELAYAYKSGEDVKLDEVLASEFVFKDAGKADKANEEHMHEVFETKEITEIINKILKKGDIQLTSEKKKKILETKRKQLISIISRNAVNPQTGTPHPPERISKALEEAKFHMDLHKSAKELVEPALKSIRPIIPIKFETVNLALKIPGEHSGRLFQILHEFGEVSDEQWKGSMQYCIIKIPGGLQDEFFSKISGATHGDVEIKKIEK